ncbi:hypothetical protein BZG36_02693 [Bifiguratus adelaidae]|uniref:SLA1 homology domain-containing protein n=1 Tax=Bifiguratus adelaidae TaxID=1938954 RepID=A0A261Y217_9FUNG|nr:hypothetical protein BZG36_02693 [Bifiguratus adelaidae]
MTAHAMRAWKAADGRFQHHGSFLEVFNDNKVKIRKENGIVIAIPFARLSEEDKQYVLKRQRSSWHERPPTKVTLDDDQPLGMYMAAYAQEKTSQEEVVEDLKVGKPHPKARSELERKRVSKHPETSRPVARPKPQVASIPSVRFSFLQMPQLANGDPSSISLPVPLVPVPHRSSALPNPP